ncbi:MAG: hypothetical protein ACOYYU_19275 [Chloroflexota bacterium]
MYRINGVDLTRVDGMGVSLAQTVTMEVGSNMGEKFPIDKNFCSPGLSVHLCLPVLAVRPGRRSAGKIHVPIQLEGV